MLVNHFENLRRIAKSTCRGKKWEQLNGQLMLEQEHRDMKEARFYVSIGKADNSKNERSSVEVFWKYKKDGRIPWIKDNVKKGLCIRTAQILAHNWTIGEDKIEVVKSFVYLGYKVNQTNDITQEIRQRNIMNGTRTGYRLQRILRSPLIQINNKISLYKTLIRLTDLKHETSLGNRKRCWN